MEIVLLAIGALLGAASSWYFSRRYYIRAGADQKKDLGDLSEQLRPQNTLLDFEHLLVTDCWDKEIIDDHEVWVCRSNNLFQIAIGQAKGSIQERWATVYTDKSAVVCPVYLKIDGNVVKEVKFVYMDGYRIFVPMAEISQDDPMEDPVDFFWDTKSLEIKVCHVIGEYYVYKSLGRIAEKSGVTIIQ